MCAINPFEKCYAFQAKLILKPILLQLASENLKLLKGSFPILRFAEVTLRNLSIFDQYLNDVTRCFCAVIFRKHGRDVTMATLTY